MAQVSELVGAGAYHSHYFSSGFVSVRLDEAWELLFLLLKDVIQSNCFFVNFAILV